MPHLRYKENVQRQEFKSVESKVRYVPYFKDWRKIDLQDFQ